MVDRAGMNRPIDHESLVQMPNGILALAFAAIIWCALGLALYGALAAVRWVL